MKKLIFTLGALALTLAASSCGHHKLAYDAVTTSETDGKGVAAQVIWLKPKGDSVDMRITLSNRYANAVSFTQSAIKVSYNGQMGQIAKNEFAGEMAGGASQTGLLIARFQPHAPKNGTVTLTIDPIYQGENVAIDKPDSGKKLAPLRVDLKVP